MKKVISVVALVLLLSTVVLSFEDTPQIIFNLHSQPFPDIPFPNDILTREDKTTWTGKRINIPVVGITEAEKRMRSQLNTLNGFSTFAPIFVSFSLPLDITNIKERHRKIDDYKNHAVYLFCADRKSKNFGRATPLDLNHGNFPVLLEETQLFLNDTRGTSSNVLFETEDEISLKKDTNFDGKISKANILPSGGDQYSNLITFYDVNTNTLILRPILPLAEETKYIVILTKRLKGENEKSIVPPFGNIYHPQQKQEVKSFIKSGHLKKYGLKKEDIAFAWTFTTQSISRDLVAIYEGLYGIGTFKKLNEEFPVSNALTLHPLKSSTSPNFYIMEAKDILKILKPFTSLVGIGEEALDDFKYVDYLVSGSIRVPYFLMNKTNVDFYSEEIFHLNSKSGEYEVSTDEVTFLLSLPKATEEHKPPFPLVFFSHGYTGSRLTLLMLCGILSKYGVAAIALDSVGHGSDSLKKEIESYMPTIKGLGMSNFIETLLKGRDRDLDGDGVGDSGGDYWTAYIFHTRDVVRQTVVDYMQTVRVFRAFDGKNTWYFSEIGKIAGDFNGDGVVDTGGPNNYYAIIGASLGGIISSIVAAMEPNITVAVPVVGGGGLSDIGIRSLQGGVPQAVTLRLMGPLVVNIKQNDEDVLAFQVTDVNRDRVLPFAKIIDIKEGDKVIVINETKGMERYGEVDRENKLRVGIPADTGDKILVRIYDENKNLKQEISTFEMEGKYQNKKFEKQSPLTSPVEGFGLIRNTPFYRQFFTIAQTVLDPADPINYAKYYLNPIPIRPQGKVSKNILFIPTVGDMNVPINTGVALARAAGLVPLTYKEAKKDYYYYGRASLSWEKAKSYPQWLSSKMKWKNWTEKYGKKTTPNQILLDEKVVEGLEKLHPLSDVDDLSFGRSGFGQPTLSLPLRIIRKTKSGISAIRIPYVIPTGSHGFDPYSSPKYEGIKSDFNLGKYLTNQIGHYISTRGKELIDDECWERGDCRKK